MSGPRPQGRRGRTGTATLVIAALAVAVGALHDSPRALAQEAGAGAVETAPLPRFRPARPSTVLLPNGSRAPEARDTNAGAATARTTLAPPAGIESTDLAPPAPEAAPADTGSEAAPVESAATGDAETPDTGPDGERIIEDPAEAAEAAATGDEAGTGGRFKRAPFKTPEFPEVDRSITIGATDDADSARVAVLDMVSASTETVELAAGRPLPFQRLTLTLLACAKPEQQGGIGDVGLIEITDARQGDEPVFSGWMFAESPALSALDHPRYDVWLISCIARSPDIVEGNAENEASRDSASASSAR